MLEKNPNGINTGNALQRTSCPVTPARLRAMYVDECLSVLVLCKMWGTSDTNIRAWLKMAGIPIRSFTEAARVANLTGRRKPAVLREKRYQVRLTNSEYRRIGAIAQHHNLSASALIRRFIRAGLAAIEGK